MAKTEFTLAEATAFFAVFYGGEHHFPNEIKHNGFGWSMIDKFRDFSTYDGNELTRLVVYAHDFALRVSLQPVPGPNGRMKICVWKRERDGGLAERHPELAEHAESIRSGAKAYFEKNPDYYGNLYEPENADKERETPISLKAAGHLFVRYLRDNPHAEEMKCRCGFVIWPCWTEEEAKEAIKNLNGGTLKMCKYK